MTKQQLLDLAERLEGLSNEIWRRAVATGGRYEISNLGNVRRYDGLILSHSKPRSTREYPCVHLRYDGIRKRVSVHRLVAINFLGLPPFAGAEVRHLDGNHMNHSIDNLAWGTRKENAADRERHGTTARGPRPNRVGKATGSDNGNYKVTPEMKRRAIDLVAAGYTQRKAAAEIGISQKSVWSILRAKASMMEDE